MMYVGGESGLPPVVSSQVACWWATDLVGIYANSASVDSWTDHLLGVTVSASTTERPTFLTSGLGGKPAVDFDGSSDILRYAASNAVTTSDRGVIVAVVEADTINGGAVWGTADEASATRFMAGSMFNTGGNNRLFWQQRDNDTQDQERGQTTVVSTGTKYILEWSSSNTDTHGRVNNVDENMTSIAGSSNGDWFVETNNRDNFTMGAIRRSTIISYFDGRIAYLMVADAQLSSGDRTALYDFLTTYYGI